MASLLLVISTILHEEIEGTLHHFATKTSPQGKTRLQCPRSSASVLNLLLDLATIATMARIATTPTSSRAYPIRYYLLANPKS